MSTKNPYSRNANNPTKQEWRGFEFFDTHDGQVTLAEDHRRGLWSCRITLPKRSAQRLGGQLPTSASAHSLLAVALQSALRSITKGDITRVAELKNLEAGTRKLRLQIVTSDSTFAKALQGLIARDASAPRLRAGRNFLTAVAQQLVRFDLDYATDPQSKETQILGNWAKASIHDPRLLAHAAVLLPSVLAETGFDSRLR